jgi:hypothetical protein
MSIKHIAESRLQNIKRRDQRSGAAEQRPQIREQRPLAKLAKKVKASLMV